MLWGCKDTAETWIQNTRNTRMSTKFIYECSMNNNYKEFLFLSLFSKGNVTLIFINVGFSYNQVNFLLNKVLLTWIKSCFWSQIFYSRNPISTSSFCYRLKRKEEKRKEGGNESKAGFINPVIPVVRYS